MPAVDVTSRVAMVTKVQGIDVRGLGSGATAATALARQLAVDPRCRVVDWDRGRVAYLRVPVDAERDVDALVLDRPFFADREHQRVEEVDRPDRVEPAVLPLLDLLEREPEAGRIWRFLRDPSTDPRAG